MRTKKYYSVFFQLMFIIVLSLLIIFNSNLEIDKTNVEPLNIGKFKLTGYDYYGNNTIMNTCNNGMCLNKICEIFEENTYIFSIGMEKLEGLHCFEKNITKYPVYLIIFYIILVILSIVTIFSYIFLYFLKM